MLPNSVWMPDSVFIQSLFDLKKPCSRCLLSFCFLSLMRNDMYWLIMFTDSQTLREQLV